MRRFRWLLIFPGLLVVVLLGFVVWTQTPLGPEPEAAEALQSSVELEVIDNGWWEFVPRDQTATAGLVLYPGGRVDWRSYAPVARAIAEEGILVVLAPMPLNLAVFSAGAAEEIIRAHPQISSWIVGGHSLGGAMAANYVYQKGDQVKGLVLWAAYPAEANDLSQTPVAVLSLYGSEDGLATLDKIEASRLLLPQSAVFTVIEGGNHAQFGSYGEQPGDGIALISAADQRDKIVQATVEFIRGLEE